MKALLPILGLLLAYGCEGSSTPGSADAHVEVSDGASKPRYAVLEEPPDAVLDTMDHDLPLDKLSFQRRWTQEASAFPLDGQRAVNLLEIACYADVMCHPVEYPLRVATLDYIDDNMHVADVKDSVHWIQTSYKSALPLETPGDETGQLRGIVVQAMGIRMADYAEELLQPQIPSQHR